MVCRTWVLLLGISAALAPVVHGGERIVLPTDAMPAAFDGAQLRAAVRAKLPQATPEVDARVAAQFLDHLRLGHPIQADQLAANRMNPDDLASELDVFLSDHPELTGAPRTIATEDPGTRVANVLRHYPDLASGEAERRQLADRFLAKLSSTAGIAYQALQSGRMAADELESRVGVFAGDIRAERSRVPVDAAAAAAGPLIDAYEKANFGDIAQRPESVSYRGEVEQAGKRRQFVMFEKRPNKVRIEIIERDLTVAILAFDGVTAWQQTIGRPPVPASATEARDLAELAEYDDPFLGYRDRGAVARVVEKPEHGPVRISLKESSGAEMEALIDPVTYREISRRNRLPNGAWTETKLGDYRRVGPLNLAFRQERWNGGRLASVTRLANANVDPGLIDAFFAKPTDAAMGYMDYMGGLAVLAARGAPPNSSSPLTLPGGAK